MRPPASGTISATSNNPDEFFRILDYVLGSRPVFPFWPDRPGRLPRARPLCLWRGPTTPLAIAVDTGMVRGGPTCTGWVIPFTAFTIPG